MLQLIMIVMQQINTIKLIMEVHKYIMVHLQLLKVQQSLLGQQIMLENMVVTVK